MIELAMAAVQEVAPPLRNGDMYYVRYISKFVLSDDLAYQAIRFNVWRDLYEQVANPLEGRRDQRELDRWAITTYTFSPRYLKWTWDRGRGGWPWLPEILPEYGAIVALGHAPRGAQTAVQGP